MRLRWLVQFQMDSFHRCTVWWDCFCPHLNDKKGISDILMNHTVSEMFFFLHFGSSGSFSLLSGLWIKYSRGMYWIWNEVSVKVLFIYHCISVFRNRMISCHTTRIPGEYLFIILRFNENQIQRLERWNLSFFVHLFNFSTNKFREILNHSKTNAVLFTLWAENNNFGFDSFHFVVYMMVPSS